MNDVPDRLLHKGRGVVEESDLHTLRNHLLNPGDHVLDSIDHRHGGGLGALHRDDDDDLFTFHQDGVLLHPAHEADFPNIAQIDKRVAFPLDRNIFEFFNLQR